MDIDQTIKATENRVVAASPVLALIQPTALLVNCLPQALIVDLVNHYAQEMAGRRQAGFLEKDFDQWVADIYRDLLYGKGEDAGDVQDWMER